MRRALLTAAAVVAAGCLNVSTPLEPNAPLGTPFALKLGQSAVVPGGLTVRFDAVVSDSRCPIDAICVQAGEARIAMTLSVRSQAYVQREWRTSPTGFEVRFEDFAIQLGELYPYPAASRPTAPGDYAATVTVIRR